MEDTKQQTQTKEYVTQLNDVDTELWNHDW